MAPLAVVAGEQLGRRAASQLPPEVDAGLRELRRARSVPKVIYVPSERVTDTHGACRGLG
jgi:hypothetical protein